MAKYEDWFRNLMHGALNSKSKHSNKVFREISKKYEGGICTIENLKSRAETLFQSTLSVHDKITIIDFSRIAEIENATIWKKKIVGKADVDIANLISRLNIYDWLQPIGNIKNQTFHEIWNGSESKKQLEMIKNKELCSKNCPQCRVSKYNELFERLLQTKSVHFI